MKLIKAIIQPHRLEAVRDALKEGGIGGITVYEAKGYGRQKGHKEVYRGAEYQIHFLPKTALEIVVPDETAQLVIRLILKAAGSGNIGDGKIFVLDVGHAVRIRTGEEDDQAI